MVPTGEALDAYVRVAKADLSTMTARHLASAIDLSIAVPEGIQPEQTAGVLTGYTEWIAASSDNLISVGWDWGVLATTIVVLNPAEIRSNVRVILESGRAASAVETRLYLFEWIETLPWREIVRAQLMLES